MSKGNPEKSDELRSEYDFAGLAGGVRGKHLRRYRKGTNLALLDPDVAEAFPTDEAVNEALRTLLKAAAAIRVARRSSGKVSPGPSGAGKVGDKPRARRRTGRP